MPVPGRTQAAGSMARRTSTLGASIRSEAQVTMRRRPSARLLILDDARRVLLFRFVHKGGVLAGQDY
jgi:hypothetical protein